MCLSATMQESLDPRSHHFSLPTDMFVRLTMQSKVQSCEHCRDLFSSQGSLQASSPSRHKTSTEPLDEEKDELKEQLRQLELELAQTKLQLVEAKCRIQVSCTFERRFHHYTHSDVCPPAQQSAGGKVSCPNCKADIIKS